MKKSTTLLLLLVVALSGYLLNRINKGNHFLKLNYVVTETQGPDSFDPKDADKTQNLSVMRMLYATPLEIDRTNRLQSYVLESFEYDEVRSVISFTMKSGIKYSDNTPMTIRDVALSIARLAYNRPDFPVIKNIIGIKKWTEKQNGISIFPEGITLKENQLEIHFNKRLANPLFRFCLELFSIVPEKCLDLNSTKMTCSIPPFSGYFEMESKTADEIHFKKRTLPVAGFENIPFEKIVFQYKTLKLAMSEHLDTNQIISGAEMDYLSIPNEKRVEAKQIHWLPSARFMVLRFNPKTDLFSSKEHRQFFAQKFRELLKREDPSLIVESSLFPRLLPGYLAESEFEQTKIDLTKRFKNEKIRLPRFTQSSLSLGYEMIIKTATALGMDVQIDQDLTSESVLNGFLSGTYPVVAGASGFWAQDPIGDVSMWFTKNLHKTMTFVWNDENIYKKISDLEEETRPEGIRKKMEGLNRHIFSESLIAPTLHYRRFFISSPDVKGLNLPQAITSPAPWQLMVIP